VLSATLLFFNGCTEPEDIPEEGKESDAHTFSLASVEGAWIGHWQSAKHDETGRFSVGLRKQNANTLKLRVLGNVGNVPFLRRIPSFNLQKTAENRFETKLTNTPSKMPNTFVLTLKPVEKTFDLQIKGARRTAEVNGRVAGEKITGHYSESYSEWNDNGSFTLFRAETTSRTKRRGNGSPSSTGHRPSDENNATPVLLLKSGQSVTEARKQVKKFLGGGWSKGRRFAMTEGLGHERYRTFGLPFGPSGYLVLTPDLNDVREVHYLQYPPKLKGNRVWHETEQLKWVPKAFIQVGEKLSAAKKKVTAAGGTWMQPAQFEDGIAQETCVTPSMSAGFTVMETKAGPYEHKRGVLLCADPKQRRITEIKTRVLPIRQRGNWRTAKILPISGSEVVSDRDK
jgi:hypothetical protein